MDRASDVMKVIVERLFIYCFSFPGKTIWNQLYLKKFESLWEKSEILEVKSAHVQESKEASGTQPAKADWSRNYFVFAILSNTISISR